MRKILILMGRYLPGYKDGGPVRTMINVTEALGDEYDLRIVCADRDHGDDKPYPDIKYGEWNAVGKAKVRYLEPKGFSFGTVQSLAKDADMVYSCGFYDDYGYKALILNRLNKLGGKPLVVAPMGTFSEGALRQKKAKKKLFIGICKALGLFNNITWSVTSETEAEEMKREISAKAKYIVAEDLPRSGINCEHMEYSGAGRLNIVFISRISPKKNLLCAINILSGMKEDISFHIYGFMEDEAYWSRCRTAIEALPENIRCEYRGEIASESVPEVMAQYDVFLFPTMGENYGHVIFEAMASGCIPVISDRTPWTYIASENAGYALPLDDESAFAEVLRRLCAADADELEKTASNAVSLARAKAEDCGKNTGYRTVFG